MKRLLIACALVLSAVLPASAQGTVMPIPLAQWLDNDGAVLTSGGLCVYRAGTASLATTYTTAALSVSNANPILFSSGRASTGGVFLRPGTSYKFVLKDFVGVVSPTCIPDTGTTIWTVDNVEATPGSAPGLDVTGTFGETVSAGSAVFLSTGAGGLNAGRWYKTDADLTYKSVLASLVGIAPDAITSGDEGRIRVSGAVTVPGPLTTGAPYYAGATAGAIVSSAPTNAIRIGAAQSTTELLIGFTEAPVAPRSEACGRLTLTSGLPVTVADVTAATTVYYTPAGSCNTIFLYDGTAWSEYPFPELSIAVPSVSSKIYDVWAYDNAGAVALEVLAWTSDTARATPLASQNGVYTKTGALSRRYLGSFRTTAVAGQTEDTFANRMVWNVDNRVDRAIRVTDSTNTWPYSTAAYQQARATATNQVTIVVGVAEDAVSVAVSGQASNDASGVNPVCSIGLDSTTVPATGILQTRTLGAVANATSSCGGQLITIPAVGFHTFVWLEYDNTGGGTTTWVGDGGGVLTQTGLTGRWKS